MCDAPSVPSVPAPNVSHPDGAGSSAGSGGGVPAGNTTTVDQTQPPAPAAEPPATPAPEPAVPEPPAAPPVTPALTATDTWLIATTAGDPCVFAWGRDAPTRGQPAFFELYTPDYEPYGQIDRAFRETGPSDRVDPTVMIRTVGEAQCGALRAAMILHANAAGRISLEFSSDDIGRGDPLSGSLTTEGAGDVAVFLVRPDGGLTDLSARAAGDQAVRLIAYAEDGELTAPGPYVVVAASGTRLPTDAIAAAFRPGADNTAREALQTILAKRNSEGIKTLFGVRYFKVR